MRVIENKIYFSHAQFFILRHDVVGKDWFRNSITIIKNGVEVWLGGVV